MYVRSKFMHHEPNRSNVAEDQRQDHSHAKTRKNAIIV